MKSISNGQNRGNKFLPACLRLICVIVFTFIFTCQTYAETFTKIVPDAADPFIYKEHQETEGIKYYLYSTKSNSYNTPIYKSTDLVTWSSLGDAMPATAKWAKPRSHWAPEVISVNDKFLLYYSAREKDSGLHCVSVAISSQAAGPYIDSRSSPLICQRDQGGSIDPSPYQDTDGKIYLLWKNAGLRFRIKTHIWITPLSNDGLSIQGKSEILISNDTPWEGASVEAPTLIKKDSNYYLFYSGAAFNTPRYAVGYAVSDNLMGPYVKSKNNPVLKTGNDMLAPGHAGIFRDKTNEYWIVFHAYDGDIKNGKRNTRIKKLKWYNSTPQIQLNVEP